MKIFVEVNFFNEKTNLDNTFRMNYIPKSNNLYELLTEYGIDNETAINVESWCEIATIGEIYDGDGFSIEILDDN